MQKNDPYLTQKKAAIAEYLSGRAVSHQPTPEFRVLFVLFRSVTVGKQTFTVKPGDISDRIFYEAVENFKCAVEHFAKGRVQIVPTVRAVTQNVVSTLTTYLQHADIAPILAELAPAGMYDSVIAVSGGSWAFGGATLARLFDSHSENNWRMYGYAGCAISERTDAPCVGKGYDKRVPYLVTTNIFIHEWMHQLEGYRAFLRTPFTADIIYPYTHAYFEDFQKPPAEPWQSRSSYSWDEGYFDDTAKYPHAVERRLTSFYRAVLACEVTFLPFDRHPVGMYPAFWVLTPHTLLQPAQSAAVPVHPKPGSVLLITDGRYQLIDAATGLYVSGKGSGLGLSAAGTAWSFISAGNGYYRIVTRTDGMARLFDVLNAHDGESNAVQLFVETGYPAAQCWRIVAAENGRIKLCPMLSRDKGLTVTADSAAISVSCGTFLLKRLR